MRKEKKHLSKRMVRNCRACGGGGRFVVAGQVVECRKCRGTGRTRNK